MLRPLAIARRSRLDPLRVDRAVAAVLVVLVQIEVWVGDGAPHDSLAVATVATLTAAGVAFRRRFPATVGIAAGLLSAVFAGVWGPPSILTYGIAWMCCMYGLAVWAQPRRFAFGVLATTVANLVAAVGVVTLHQTVQFAVVALVVLLLVHRVVSDREHRAQIAERERDVAAREAVVEERARIARELHDVIAHNVSMIVVQAGAERRVLEGSNGATHEVLQTIEQIGRGALTETRRLLGMLRSDAADPLTPQPGLDDVPTLVAQLREAGLPVELRVAGERRELPVGIELSAYRIVQEALTNSLRHAGDARATVDVRYGADALELEIADDGSGGGAADPDGGGHGLVGMRERVTLYGGRFDATRTPSGGFVVRASLPIA